MNSEQITMEYIGHSYYDYPAYRDSNNRIWFDTNYGNPFLPEYLCSASGNSLEGEPDEDIKNIYSDTKIVFTQKYETNPRAFDYMMLSRYKSDCEYYLGNGNRYAGHLYFKDPNKHIEEMEKLYNSFPNEEKPEWLTWEDIQNYKAQMCGKE